MKKLILSFLITISVNFLSAQTSPLPCNYSTPLNMIFPNYQYTCCACACNGQSYPEDIVGPQLDGITHYTYDCVNNPTIHADFTFTNSGGGNFNFIDSSVAFGSQSYSWNFGDGTSSTLSNPFHHYSTSGFYLVCLIISENGSTSQTCRIIENDNCTSCKKPTNPSHWSVNTTKETITWGITPCALKYQIRYRPLGTTTWTNKYTTTNVAEKLITGLTAGTTYQFQVRSICSINPTVVSQFTSILSFDKYRLEEIDNTDISIIQISPNPATNEIKITNLSQSENQIKIFNLLGQQVKSIDVSNEQNTTINISDLPIGLYELTIFDGEKISCKKLVKE